MRGFQARAFTWAVVEAVHGVVKFRLRDRREIAVLREVLPNQAVGIFIGPPFPG